MRAFWIVGGLHGAIGATLLFLCLHPIRDALDAQALHLVVVASAWQALNGLAVMLAAALTRAQIAMGLIGAGAAVSSGMVYVIAFAGAHPFDPAVPAGGLATVLGWLALAAARPSR